LYNVIFVLLEIMCDLKCFLSPWKHLFAKSTFLNLSTYIVFTFNLGSQVKLCTVSNW
jgi:hypothetical protein